MKRGKSVQGESHLWREKGETGPAFRAMAKTDITLIQAGGRDQTDPANLFGVQFEDLALVQPSSRGRIGWKAIMSLATTVILKEL